MKKTSIAFILTLFLGPGAGHIYLGLYKRGTILIALSLSFAVHLAWKIIHSMSITAEQISELERNSAAIIQNFNQTNPKTLFYYDIFLAAVWSYAFVDIWLQRKQFSVTVEKTGSGQDE
jgi:hypothetical protein